MAVPPALRRELSSALSAVGRALRRARGRLGPAALVELEVALAEARTARDAGDEARARSALASLDAAALRHLASFRPSAWRAWIPVLVLALVAAFGVRTFAVEIVAVPSSAMAPTLLPGDRAVLLRSAYGIPVPGRLERWRARAPRRGDVVLVHEPGEEGGLRLGRVIGRGGDRVEMGVGLLRINGVPQPRRVVAPALATWSFQPGIGWRRLHGRLVLEQLDGRRHLILEPAAFVAREEFAPLGVEVPEGHLLVAPDARELASIPEAHLRWLVPEVDVEGQVLGVLGSFGADDPEAKPSVRRDRWLLMLGREVPQRELEPELDRLAQALRAGLAAERRGEPPGVDGTLLRVDEVPPADEDGPAR